MKEILIGSLACLILISGLTVAQQIILPDNTPIWIHDDDRVLFIKGKVSKQMKQWLTIESLNGQEWHSNGFDPFQTRIITDYQPVFRRMPNKTWEIMFTRGEIKPRCP